MAGEVSSFTPEQRGTVLAAAALLKTTFGVGGGSDFGSGDDGAEPPAPSGDQAPSQNPDSPAATTLNAEADLCGSSAWPSPAI